MIRMTIHEFHQALKAQQAERLLTSDGKIDHPQREDFVFVCPMCKYPQSARDLIAAGAGADFDAVANTIGFSCVGRYTGAGSPRKEPDGKPCDWTLGGLFHTHCLLVIDDDGKEHPHFEVATAEQVAEREARNGY